MKSYLAHPFRSLSQCGARCLLIMAAFVGARSRAAPTELVYEAPAAIQRVAPGVILVDFGRVAFGNIELAPPARSGATITVRFGEALAGGRIQRHPAGAIRYAAVRVTLDGASRIVAPPRNGRNATPPAVLTPRAWGVLTPFRWVEIEGWPGTLRADQVRRRAAYVAHWNDAAAAFRCSAPLLNDVWELCHATIKATSFAGVFVDGDRERLSYEADAYLNQLSYYAGDADPRMPRDTFDRLLQYPTWPTEWAPQMVFIAYADWRQNGDRAWIAQHYDALKTKLLDDRVGPDGLVFSTPAQMARGDIVDWPGGERDGFVFRPVNTVVNAFHLRALTLMARLAAAIGRTPDAQTFAAREHAAEQVFVAKLFDRERHLFRDGVGTDHTSLHANLFPLAFGLVPPTERPAVAEWLGRRGMVCSVYAAQYLLEGLFENGADHVALGLMTAPGDRSWRHMVEAGATITWEAWDQKYKPNQDWTHAWGAAPANLLPRFVLGVQPVTPGWGEAKVQPHPGGLAWCDGQVPTPRGPVVVHWRSVGGFTLAVALPAGMTAQIWLPAREPETGVLRDGVAIPARRDGAWWVVDEPISGTGTFRTVAKPGAKGRPLTRALREQAGP